MMEIVQCKIHVGIVGPCPWNHISCYEEKSGDIMCMCGDHCCPSCGPAQGNNQCFSCRRWEDEGGCITPLKCGMFILHFGYEEEMSMMVDEKFLSDKDLKRVTAYQIMRGL